MWNPPPMPMLCALWIPSQSIAAMAASTDEPCHSSRTFLWTKKLSKSDFEMYCGASHIFRADAVKANTCKSLLAIPHSLNSLGDFEICTLSRANERHVYVWGLVYNMVTSWGQVTCYQLSKLELRLLGCCGKSSIAFMLFWLRLKLGMLGFCWKSHHSEPPLPHIYMCSEALSEKSQKDLSDISAE